MALYPDTSFFYPEKVIAASSNSHPPLVRVFRPNISMTMYRLKFEEDDDQEHSVSARSRFRVSNIWPLTAM